MSAAGEQEHQMTVRPGCYFSCGTAVRTVSGQILMFARGGSGERPTRTLGQAVRWPVAATSLAVALVVASFILDRFPGTGRDYSLVIGGPALTVLLPLSVAWLVAALVLHYRRRRRRSG